MENKKGIKMTERERKRLKRLKAKADRSETEEIQLQELQIKLNREKAEHKRIVRYVQTHPDEIKLILARMEKSSEHRKANEFGYMTYVDVPKPIEENR